MSPRWDCPADEPAPCCYCCRVWTPQVCQTGPAEVRASVGSLLWHLEEKHRAVQQLCFRLCLSLSTGTSSLFITGSPAPATCFIFLFFCISCFLFPFSHSVNYHTHYITSVHRFLCSLFLYLLFTYQKLRFVLCDRKVLSSDTVQSVASSHTAVTQVPNRCLCWKYRCWNELTVHI